MAFDKLSPFLLKDAIHKAMELKLEEEFIQLLLNEMRKREREAGEIASFE